MLLARSDFVSFLQRKLDEAQFPVHVFSLLALLVLHNGTDARVMTSSQGQEASWLWSMCLNILEVRADSGFYRVLLKLGQVCQIHKGTGSQLVVVYVS